MKVLISLKSFHIFLLCLLIVGGCTNYAANNSSYDSESQDLNQSIMESDFSMKSVENGKNNDKEDIIVKDNSDLVKYLRISGADAQATKRGVVINLPDAFFEFDRYVLTPDAIRALGEISRVLKKLPDRTVSVEGHTDYIGRVTYNKDLSLKRANAVLSELKNQGVSSREMNVKGYGEGYPIATNNSELGRSRNRRVEIVVSKQ